MSEQWEAKRLSKQEDGIMELSKEIYKLTEYGIKNNLIEEED